MATPLAPHLSPVQRAASLAGSYDPVPRVCVVTGGTGFVGQRLVEMLVERGAHRVISFDIVPKPADAWSHPAIEWRVGDICNMEQVCDAVRGADCVWHNAAAVGPYHPKPLYWKVRRVLRRCAVATAHRTRLRLSSASRCCCGHALTRWVLADVSGVFGRRRSTTKAR